MRKIRIKGKKVFPQDVEDSILKESYTKLGEKMTVCHLTLVNGHEVIGVAGIVNSEDYNLEIGSKISKERALEEVWKHLGSILQNQIEEISEEEWYEQKLVESFRKGHYNVIEEESRNPQIKGFKIGLIRDILKTSLHILYINKKGETIRNTY